jgi:hypothetical protein
LDAVFLLTRSSAGAMDRYDAFRLFNSSRILAAFS